MNMFQNLKDKVQKQNAQTRERLEDLKEKVIDVKLAAKMGMINLKTGVGAVADETLDFINILNPLAFRKGDEEGYVPDEEEAQSEEMKAAKAAEAERKRVAHAARVAASLASIPPDFFEAPGTSDPLRATLAALPPSFGEDHLREEEERLANVVSVASSELSAQVLENYSAMVEGINKVSEVMNHLQMSVIVAKNARRTLARADAEVSAAITVGKGTRKKGALLEVLEILTGLAGVLNVEATLRAALTDGKYVAAVLAYAEAHAQLQAFGDLHVAAPVRDGMAGMLWDVVRKVEEGMQAAVGRFDASRYPPLFEAYVLLGEEIKPLGDRVQECALKAVEAATEEALRSLTAERAAAEAARAAAEGGEAGAAAAGRRLAFKEAVRLLPRESYRVCLGRTLAAVFDVLASLQRMHAWHRARFVQLGGVWKERAPPAPPPPKWVHDAASGYYYDATSGCHFDPKTKMYYDPKKGAWGATGPPPPGAPAAAPAPAPAPETEEPEAAAAAAAAGDATEPQSPGNKAAAAAAAAHSRHKSGLDRDAYALSAMAAGEKAACEAVALSIDRCRRAVWELAATRIAALLAAPCAPGAPGVLRLLAVARRWASAGEGFAGVDAALVRQHIAAAADRFFEALHRQRLEALQAKLNAETWAPVTGDAAAGLRASLLDAAAGLGRGGAGAAAGEVVGAGAAANALFAECVAAGNPFTGAGEGRGGAWDAVGVDEAARAAANTAASAADAAASAVLAAAVGLAGAKPVVTASSHYAFTVATEYLRLLRQLRGSPAVLTGLTHLFEFTLLAVFRAFGQASALNVIAAPTGALAQLAGTLSGVGGSDAPVAAPAHLTPRLRTTLQRLAALQTAAKLAPPADAAAPGAPASGPAALLLSSGNLYGLPQRSVATEALACLAEELKRLRPVLKGALPADQGAKLDHFYTHSVEAVQDLREHVYAQVARLLLNVPWLPEAIGDGDGSSFLKAGKYDVRELSCEHNAWAERLVTEFRQFAAKLACCDLAPEALGAMWDNAATAAAEGVLAGLARVRKCTQEGRALMALDVSVLASALKRMAPPSSKPDAALRTVETYIKAFYVPEGELLHWAQTHAEYSVPQLVALVNQIAYAYKWSRTARGDLVAKIEAGVV
jgi:hypothetical protein